MKKMFTVLVAIAMVMAIFVPAFAAETYTITINQDNPNHKYEVYQIFTGDLSDELDADGKPTGKKILASIEWGTGINADGIEYFTGKHQSAQGTADSLKVAADAEAFADTIVSNNYLGTLKSVSYVEGTGYQVTDLEAGYYLIIEKADSLTDTTEGYTSYILKVVETITVEPKDGETTFEKKVDDANDSNYTEAEIVWNDSADHDIGDLIDFKLESTITKNYDAYEEYYLAFHDTEETGLTFQPDTVKVYVDGTEITEGFTVVTDTEDEDTFDVIFADLKDIAAVEAGSKVTVTYKSKLNSNAVLGNQGNVNKAYAEFSNNPNDDSHGKTKDDSVIVFTYKVTVNKVDADNQPLAGAAFTLEKFVAAEDGTDTYNNIAGNWVALSTVEAEPETTFTFTGLDDGTYRLTETEAPVGYNAIDPICFNVTASHDIEWTTQTRTAVLTDLTGNAVTGEIEFTKDMDKGNIGTDIVNVQGVVLPETGGIGTTIFYIVGALLVVGAAILLITKKRMNSVNS